MDTSPVNGITVQNVMKKLDLSEKNLMKNIEQNIEVPHQANNIYLLNIYLWQQNNSNAHAAKYGLA